MFVCLFFFFIIFDVPHDFILLSPCASKEQLAELRAELKEAGCGWSTGGPRMAGLHRCPVQLLLGAPGLTTRSKDATRGSWPYY